MQLGLMKGDQYSMSKVSDNMCPSRDHMNGPMPHAYENGFCLFCRDLDPAIKQAAAEKLVEQEDALVEMCIVCGDDVFPGSGKWVNRIPSFDTIEEREGQHYPYPTGDFICAECAEPPQELPKIELTDGAVSLIIEIISRYVTKEDPDADKATHPIEMALIDILVEKRNAYAKETGG